MTDSSLEERLQSFMESEGKSCSFDPELITPEYVYRMWGGNVAIDEIATGLTELRMHGKWRLGHVVEKTEGRIV